MQEMLRVQSLGWEDPLEREMAVELGGASRDSTGCGIIQEGLISC